MQSTKVYFNPQDLKALGVSYSWGHIKRLAKQGKIPPLLQRAPGAKYQLTQAHIDALTGRAAGAA
jgi:hypothetical protein